MLERERLGQVARRPLPLPPQQLRQGLVALGLEGAHPVDHRQAVQGGPPGGALVAQRQLQRAGQRPAAGLARGQPGQLGVDRRQLARGLEPGGGVAEGLGYGQRHGRHLPAPAQPAQPQRRQQAQGHEPGDCQRVRVAHGVEQWDQPHGQREGARQQRRAAPAHLRSQGHEERDHGDQRQQAHAPVAAPREQGPAGQQQHRQAREEGLAVRQQAAPQPRPADEEARQVEAVGAGHLEAARHAGLLARQLEEAAHVREQEQAGEERGQQPPGQHAPFGQPAPAPGRHHQRQQRHAEGVVAAGGRLQREGQAREQGRPPARPLQKIEQPQQQPRQERDGQQVEVHQPLHLLAGVRDGHAGQEGPGARGAQAARHAVAAPARHHQAQQRGGVEQQHRPGPQGAQRQNQHGRAEQRVAEQHRVVRGVVGVALERAPGLAQQPGRDGRQGPAVHARVAAAAAVHARGEVAVDAGAGQRQGHEGQGREQPGPAPLVHQRSGSKTPRARFLPTLSQGKQRPFMAT